MLKRPFALKVVRITLGVLLGLVAMTAATLLYAVPMPGSSFTGSAPNLSDDEQRVEHELRRHVEELALEIGVRQATEGDSLRRAERYLEAQLEPLTSLPGVTLRREPLIDVPAPAANLVLDLPGTRPGPLVLVGAHYDSAPGGTPAANDNASGSAAAVVLAQRLAKEPHDLPLRFVLFANEEMPYFGGEGMGSLQHARSCRARNEQLRAMFSLETMGYFSNQPGSQRYPAPLSSLYPDRGNFIGFVGNLASRGLVREAIGRFRAHARVASEGAALPPALPGIGWSDHWAFWQVGYPAVMVTDTALFRDPSYHRRSDTPEHMDFAQLTRVVVGLEGMLLDLARAD